MTTATTTDTLARLRELAQRATPGPWRNYTNWHCAAKLKGCYIDAQGTMPARIADVLSHGGVGSQEQCETNATLIAVCDPQTIIRMLDVIAAADAMRSKFFPIGINLHESGCTQCDSAHAYDAARKALDER